MLYIIRYGEIGLKGLNRPFFENKLVDNIRCSVGKKTNNFKILKKQGRIILEAEDDVSENLKRVFGIVNFSTAEKASSYEELKEIVLRLVKAKKFETFRVTASRTNKDFQKTSEEVARELGALIAENTGKRVDLKNFDLNAQIEISDCFYVFFEKIGCLGGLPVGVEGKVVCFIESTEGFAAAFLAMKRGCEVIFAAPRDFDFSKISLFSPRELKFIKIRAFGGIEKIAKEENARAVAVQDRIENIKEYKTSLFVMRPLIALDDSELDNILEKIK